MQDITPIPARRDIRRGFTLVEVMVSIALVLIIILGVNQVFALTSRAIGAGNAMSSAVRDARDAQPIFVGDLSNVDTESAPFFYLNSELVAAFRNRADQTADLDYNPVDTSRTSVDRAVRTLDRNGNGLENDANDLTPRGLLSSRTHRADELKFFTRIPGRRQTGNPNSFVSAASASEFYVWYGHLRQPVEPNDSLTGRQLGVGRTSTVLQPAGSLTSSNTNLNNFYATQWVLGRVAMAMRQPVAQGTSSSSPRYIYEPGTTSPLLYYGRDPSNTKMAPFAEQSLATYDGQSFRTAEQEYIYRTHFDLIGGTISSYGTLQSLTNYMKTDPAWHDDITYRHTGFPVPPRPLTSRGVARTVPCFVRSCTQFIVEYAGDFTSQDVNGGITAPANGTGGGTDGIIDFSVIGGHRVIRWYGFPRDADGNGTILPGADVVPLRDYLGAPLPFERDLGQVPSRPNRLPLQTGGYHQETSLAVDAQYRCVWGADTVGYPRPKMVRIVMAIDDPAARLAREQFFEYVIELP